MTWDWTQVSHSNHHANVWYSFIYTCIHSVLVLEKENSEFTPHVLHLKLNICQILLVGLGLDKYIHGSNIKGLVGWGCKLHQLHLCRKVRPNKCPGYDTKPSDVEAPLLELWEIWNTSSLPLIQGPLWPEVVVPVRVQFIGQIQLFHHSLCFLKIFNYVQTNELWLSKKCYLQTFCLQIHYT